MTQHQERQGGTGRNISLGVCAAGGRIVAACLADPHLMAQENRAGEIAARVYLAMVAEGVAESESVSNIQHGDCSPTK